VNQSNRLARCSQKKGSETFVKFLLIFILLVATSVHASVDIAFIEILKPNGKPLQLETNGRFAHMAISFEGHWLHAHPVRGVELVSRTEVEKVGKIKEVIRVDEFILSGTRVSTYLGKPFDREYSWSDEKMYCSELIAKLLSIPPEPMHFDPRLWPPQYQKYEGLPGISPDDIYLFLNAGMAKP
jgi:hypothetical protein